MLYLNPAYTDVLFPRSFGRNFKNLISWLIFNFYSDHFWLNFCQVNATKLH